MGTRRQDAWTKRQTTKGWRTFRSQVLRPPVGFSFRKVCRVFEDAQPLTTPRGPLGLLEFSKTLMFPETNPVPGCGRMLKYLLNWQEFQFLLLCFFFFLSSSPFCIPNGFREHIVSPIQIHDPVLQVEFPFVLTSVDLQERKWMNVGVESRPTFHFTVEWSLMFIRPIKIIKSLVVH